MTKYYKVSPGFTTMAGVASETGGYVQEEDMGPGFTPLSSEEQQRRWGRVMYEEYTPQEGEEVPVMTGGAPPPVITAPPESTPETPTRTAQEVDSLSEEDIRQIAEDLGLGFPTDTPISRIKAAVKKRLQEDEAKKGQ
jgi:hypothetical protein